MAVLIGVLRNWDLAICCGGSVKYAIANLLHVIASMQYVFATWKAASCRAAVLIAQTNVCATSSIAKCPDQMPVNFLTPSQRQNYGQYAAGPSQEELERYFHLSESDRDLIGQKRLHHNRLGFALQLTTARFLGTFLENPIAVPPSVVKRLCVQLGIQDSGCVSDYQDQRQHFAHRAEIRNHVGYREFSDRDVGFRLTRWLYAQCWTGTERPGALFDRAVSWLLANKVLLPGVSVLERFVSRLRRGAKAVGHVGSMLKERRRRWLSSLSTTPRSSLSSLSGVR